MITHIFNTMGTTASLQLSLRDEDSIEELIRNIEKRFIELESIFSTYKENSYISKLNRKEQNGDIPHDAAIIFGQASRYYEITQGYFDIQSENNLLDPSGIVKAYAIHEAGIILDNFNIEEWCLNVGGDILTSKAGYWTAGITDPFNRTSLLSKVVLKNPFLSIATSGLSERGNHIWNHKTNIASDIIQATVISEDIIFSDVIATSLIAAGAIGINLFKTSQRYEALLVTKNNQLIATNGYKDLVL